MKDSLEGLPTYWQAGHVRDVDLDRRAVLDGEGRPIAEARTRNGSLRPKSGPKRPSLLIPIARHSPRVTFLIPPEVARRAEEVAARQGKSMSQLGHEALLKEYLDRAG